MIDSEVSASNMITEMMQAHGECLGRNFGSFATLMHEALSSKTLQQIIGLTNRIEILQSHNSVSKFIKVMASLVTYSASVVESAMMDCNFE